MRTMVLTYRDRIKEPYCCNHEDCWQEVVKGRGFPPVKYPAKYEIVCPCGDSYFLCGKHGEWKGTPPLKKRKYSPRILALFGTEDGVKMVHMGSGNSLFNKIKNM